jgi:hypothetical protein
MRPALLFFLSTTLALAQGTTPKPAPTDYDVHLSDGPIDVGAEYMVHSYSNGKQMFLAERFLVVEIALYPVMKGDEVNVDMGKIGLRLNQKTLLQPVNPSKVATALKPSRWGLPGGIGVGPLNIPMGGGQGPYPKQPRAPEPDAPGGIERSQDSAEDVLLQTALEPGPHKGPVSGFVYFFFTGKPSSLKSVDLEYDGLTLKLK